MDKENSKGGRPPYYETADELQAVIDKYFEEGVPSKTVVIGPPNNRSTTSILVPTITGLILYCGFADRRSFYDLEKQDKFSYTIKRARAQITQHYEELLQSGNPTGPIFALKNFGWKDRQEIAHEGLGDLAEALKSARKRADAINS